MIPLLAALSVFFLLTAVGVHLVRRSLESAEAAQRLEQITRGVPAADESLLRSVRRTRTRGPALPRLPALRRLEQTMWQAGIYESASTLVLLIAALFALGTAAAMLVAEDALIAFGTGFALALFPLFYIRIRRKRRLNAFLGQYPYALDLIKSSLEAGHTLQRGLQVVGEEFTDPLGGEFRTVVEQTRLGLALNQALADMLQRVPLDDLRLFVVAVKVQSEVGSSLAQIVARLAEIVRTRQHLHSQIEALTAQSRLSGMVVGLLPVVVLAMFSIIQPGHTEMLLFDPTGRQILKLALGLDIGAFLIIRRILNVNY
ncbi:MAG TPA: type II secretion system F family protein [Candidatus Binataceae bacterium]|nr:type II secretion system F family protein [Candidatus Binataceae bacterium]